MTDDKDKPNNSNNPNITEVSKATQFGQPGGADPVEAVKKGTEVQAKQRKVRHSTRELARVEFKTEDVEDCVDRKFLLGAIAYRGMNNMADLLAVTKFQKALTGTSKYSDSPSARTSGVPSEVSELLSSIVSSAVTLI